MVHISGNGPVFGNNNDKFKMPSGGNKIPDKNIVISFAKNENADKSKSTMADMAKLLESYGMGPKVDKAQQTTGTTGTAGARPAGEVKNDAKSYMFGAPGDDPDKTISKQELSNVMGKKQSISNTPENQRTPEQKAFMKGYEEAFGNLALA